MEIISKKALLEQPKLSCLQARKRPQNEASEIWPKKRVQLQKKKEAFVTVTAVNNFAKFISFAAPSKETAEKNCSIASKSLEATLADCENVQQQIRSEANSLAANLQEVIDCQKFIQEGANRLADISINARNVAEMKLEEETLVTQLRNLEQQAATLEDQVERNSQELLDVKAELNKLAAQEKQQKEDRQNVKEIEGPERERLSLLSSFIKVKRSIHEKLSGHQVVSINGGRSVRIALREENISIDLEFDEAHRLVEATSTSFLAESRKERELRDRAIAENNPSYFVRAIKLLVHNSRQLREELEELRKTAETAKKPFELEYNPTKRILLALFHRGSVYAKFRIPFDYTVSPIELLHLERPESSRSLKPTAQRIQETFAAQGKGKRVSEWVLELNNVL